MTYLECGSQSAVYTYYADNMRKSKEVTTVSDENITSAESQIRDTDRSGNGDELTETVVTTEHIWLGDEIALDIKDDDIIY